MTAAVGPDSVPARRLEAQVRNLAGTLTVTRPESEVAFELSDTAGYIWRTIDGRRTVDAISRLLVQRYDVHHDVAVADVMEMVAELVALDLVTLAGPAPDTTP
jgi:Coenzyme PQQ synthesis protein D (PqqD)